MAVDAGILSNVVLPKNYENIMDTILDCQCRFII